MATVNEQLHDISVKLDPLAALTAKVDALTTSVAALAALVQAIHGGATAEQVESLRQLVSADEQIDMQLQAAIG